MAKTDPFDKYSGDYEKWFETNIHAYESEIRAVSHFIPEKGRGVEIGIGSGLFAQPLGISEGIDPSLEMRKIANSRGLHTQHGVAENIPLEDKSYDYALMVTTICFVDDPEKSVDEIWRILKDGGRIIIGFVDKNSKIGQVYQQNKQYSTFYKNAKFFSSEAMKHLLEEKGFTGIEFVQTLYGNLKEINDVQEYKEGYGEGSFVVVKGEKRR
jgi:SAM-dependent methyltransferase